MTRPPQPEPYPGDPGTTAVPVGPKPFRMDFKDYLDRPLVGVVHLTDSRDETVEIPVVDGVLQVVLEPGEYRLVAVLVDPDERPVYRMERVSL